MKRPEEYQGDAPSMMVSLKRVSPAFAYAHSLNAEQLDLQKRLKEITTKKAIAQFLMRHDADEMHMLIDEVQRGINEMSRNM